MTMHEVHKPALKWHCCRTLGSCPPLPHVKACYRLQTFTHVHAQMPLHLNTKRITRRAGPKPRTPPKTGTTTLSWQSYGIRRKAPALYLVQLDLGTLVVEGDGEPTGTLNVGPHCCRLLH